MAKYRMLNLAFGFVPAVNEKTVVWEKTTACKHACGLVYRSGLGREDEMASHFRMPYACFEKS